MKDALMIIGAVCFFCLYFVLVPIALIGAPTMEDDYDEDDLEKTYNMYADELNDGDTADSKCNN